jgi:hypothetical protein
MRNLQVIGHKEVDIKSKKTDWLRVATKHTAVAAQQNEMNGYNKSKVKESSVGYLFHLVLWQLHG